MRTGIQTRGRAVLGLSVTCLLFAFCAMVHAESLQMGRFGTVELYHGSPHPTHVVLFLSGDSGWDEAAARLAAGLSSQTDSLIVGIDSGHYLRELDSVVSGRCHFPAAGLEALSKFVQKSLGFPNYVTPLLVGCLSGGSLAYGAMVQAPPGTFAGVVSLGFCPHIALSRPLCKGYGLKSEALPGGKGYTLLPAPEVTDPWTVLQGGTDSVCSAGETRTFIRQVDGARLEIVPGEGHAITDASGWLPAVKQALTGALEAHRVYRKSITPMNGPKDLPLVVLEPRNPEKDLLAVIVTGDGGWASIDRQIGETLAERGIPVVGLSSLQYFWKQRTQKEMSADMGRILQYYLSLHEGSRAVLIGYSLGADVLPFMASQLPDALKDKVAEIALLGPSMSTEFEFHLADWIGGSGHAGHPTKPEVEKLKGMKILCFHGEDEEDSLCPHLSPGIAVDVQLPGGHHFDGDFGPISDRIVSGASPNKTRMDGREEERNGVVE
jgi:type IV secretory pathway VirJ component